jgi:hypothetical protein
MGAKQQTDDNEAEQSFEAMLMTSTMGGGCAEVWEHTSRHRDAPSVSIDTEWWGLDFIQH